MSGPFKPNTDLQHVPEVKEGYVLTIGPVRWKAYKPGYKGNRKGRWQAMNEYGGWDNCETPAEVWPEFIDYDAMRAEVQRQAAEIARLREERDRLRAALEAIANVEPHHAGQTPNEYHMQERARAALKGGDDA